MGIFVSAVRHNCDKKTATENKIQNNNVRHYKIGEYSCDITKYNFWICGVLQVFPSNYETREREKERGEQILSEVALDC